MKKLFLEYRVWFHLASLVLVPVFTAGIVWAHIGANAQQMSFNTADIIVLKADNQEVKTALAVLNQKVSDIDANVKLLVRSR